MTESQYYELLGRKQAHLEEVVSNYGNLIAVVRGIKDGSISIDRLSIGESGIWTLAPEIAKQSNEAA